MIYANHTKITPEQEKALLDFVAGGKGVSADPLGVVLLPEFRALHCARRRRSSRSTAPGEFTAEITQGEHPVMAGVKPFQVWDETYVHTKNNAADRTVLMERVDAAGREPWTWVRTHGKGRVFYTAYGHDERVWSNPNFHQLMRNAHPLGRRAGDRRRSSKAEAFSRCKYTKTGRAGPQLRAPRPAPLLQEALTIARKPPKHMQVPPGLRAHVVRVRADDQATRLRWRGTSAAGSGLLETKDYPNNKQPPARATTCIRILEDTNRDGTRRQVHRLRRQAQHPERPGLRATAASWSRRRGEFMFLKDTNGDDKADVRETIVTGWGTSDTHALAVEPQVRPGQLALGRGRLLRLPRHGRTASRTADVAGALSLLA